MVLALRVLWRLPAERAASPDKPNVILVVLDQLDANHLHCYGNPRPTSPNIDRLAAQGVRFSHYYSVTDWTSPSYATMMTGVYPSRHTVTMGGKPEDPAVYEKLPMLAEEFKAHGYLTAAWVNNALAGEAVTGRGFEEYSQGQPMSAVIDINRRRAHMGTAAPQTMAEVLPWLDQHRAQPFFLFLLFFEPHAPYDPPPQDDLFKSDAYPDRYEFGVDLQQGFLRRRAALGDEKAVERLRQLYDGKIHYIDGYVGELTERLKQLDLDKHTLLVLTSDHGELLFSHPADFLTSAHSVALYDPVIHVPLILWGAGLPAGHVVNALASNVDQAPTILDLAGLPPLPGVQGRSLTPVVEGKSQSGDPYVFSEVDGRLPERSVRSLHYKLILNLLTGKQQLFNLDSDPDEQIDVAGEDPSVFKEFQRQLDGWRREIQPGSEGPEWHVRTVSPKVSIVDEQAIAAELQLHGSGWHSDEVAENGHWVGGCFWTKPGDGSRQAVWRPWPLAGKYRVYVYYGRLPAQRVATNAPFTVVTESGATYLRVNFSKGTQQWNLLGTYQNPRRVRVTNAANGVIIVDAVKFERVD